MCYLDETTELARQNEELKILLQEYLSSKINQELEVPPTRLIRM
jgi:dynein regulatory complex protein 1